MRVAIWLLGDARVAVGGRPEPGRARPSVDGAVQPAVIEPPA